MSLKELEHIQHWIFDLDNTIYHAKYDLFKQVSKRIGQYVAEALDLNPIEAQKIQKKYFYEYGTTLHGLMINHQCDPEHFLSYVHDIDYSLLPYDDVLSRALKKLPGQKYIFTNGSKEHAKKVLSQMYIEDQFDDIFDIRIANFIPKPASQPYVEVLKKSRIDPSKALMVEDIAQNLRVPFELGMVTVWVEEQDEDWSFTEDHDQYIHHRCNHLSDWLGKLCKL
ncbi:MAG: pyrimidine 5'-nucleotidase [Pseudomonadota bacterium]